jgi:hypothetical protein
MLGIVMGADIEHGQNMEGSVRTKTMVAAPQGKADNLARVNIIRRFMGGAPPGQNAKWAGHASPHYTLAHT